MDAKNRAKFVDKKFSRELNGYSISEVNSFINDLWNYILDLENKNEMLKNKIDDDFSAHQNKISELENQIFELKINKKNAKK